MLDQSGRLYVIADGMGGHEQGEKASAYAVQTLLDLYYRSPQVSPDQRLRESISRINQGLIAYTKENLQPGEKTGTTLVAAVIRKGRLWVANVGDSRLYLIREGSIHQITRDHSLVAEMVRAGTISKEEARQSKLRNRLSRSVGIDPKLEVDIYPVISLRNGDILLLCTDGLSQYVSAREILSAAHGTAKEIVERLILLANERGGSDNVTVSVIRYEKDPGLPIKLPFQPLLLVGAGMAMLGILAVLAWLGLSWWSSQPAAFTPTASIHNTPPSTSTSISPPALANPSPLPVASAIPGRVDCEYTVTAGDNAIGVAFLFEVTLGQVYRQDGSQENMGAINTGEILLIKSILAETCAGGGGVAVPGRQ
jgi:PPM family protein phosphatase